MNSCQGEATVGFVHYNRACRSSCTNPGFFFYTSPDPSNYSVKVSSQFENEADFFAVLAVFKSK